MFILSRQISGTFLLNSMTLLTLENEKLGLKLSELHYNFLCLIISNISLSFVKRMFKNSYFLQQSRYEMCGRDSRRGRQWHLWCGRGLQGQNWGYVNFYWYSLVMKKQFQGKI